MHYKKGKHTDKEIKWGSPKRYQPGGDLEIMHPCHEDLDHDAIHAEFMSDMEDWFDNLADQPPVALSSVAGYFRPKRNKALYCKKLKGSHDYKMDRHNDFDINGDVWWCTDYLKCSACGKQKYKECGEHVTR